MSIIQSYKKVATNHPTSRCPIVTPLPPCTSLLVQIPCLAKKLASLKNAFPTTLAQDNQKAAW